MANEMQLTEKQREDALRKSNTSRMKALIATPNVTDKLKRMLGASSATFAASILDLFTGDNMLGLCNPVAVVQEAMKAAALNLPITKALGFAYIVPFKRNYKDANGVWQHEYQPTFMIGYRGLIQLALRTGQYKTIHADVVYEGENVTYSKVSGKVDISGTPTSDKVIGYFAYFQLINGFEKYIYWDRARVDAHGKKFSKSYGNGPWQAFPDAMGIKTVVRQLIGKWGIMSAEMMNAIAEDQDERTEEEVAKYANAEPMALPDEPPFVEAPSIVADPETGEIINQTPDPAEEGQMQIALDDVPAEADF